MGDRPVFLSRHLRLVLLGSGLLLILFALLLLIYLNWPVEMARQQAPLAPTLFVRP
jgi:hypothetical protein